MHRPACLFSLLALLPGCASRPEALLIIAGDQHSAYERTAQVVATVDRLKAGHPGLPMAVLLNGDTLEYGNIVARRSAGAVDFAMFAALARRAPTVVNLGNHEPEFHDVAETVARLRATGALVVSNLNNRATGRPFAPATVKIKLGSAEAAVVGVATDDLATYRVAIRPTLDLADPVVWARKNFPTLFEMERVAPNALNDDRPPGKRLGGKALHPRPVVLSHAGIKADRGIMPLVPAGTLFAGAHDHQRFVHPFARGTYVHSGSWNEYLTLAWLHRDAAGAPRWVLEQVFIPTDGPADPELAALIRETRQKHLTPDDLAVVGRSGAALGPAAAARFVAGALRTAAGVDAAFIGNTTFGAGLPAGDVTREAFNACVRFDGTIWTAEVDGVRLRQLLAAANLGPATPFAQRRGEFSFAAGPDTIEPGKTYRIATTDWGAKNTARYFGEPAIIWREQPALKLKAAVLPALAPR
ncbi:MAG: 5'-nucleotidase C-terminal domain-containing protein [Opitutae bacterium]|nr:5'-nucleotidase C-terminal domain-containing protein [Opitutae bacterium]